MKNTIFFPLVACLLFTAIAESQDFGALEKLKSREPSRRLLPMHPFDKGVEEHLKIREYSRLPFDGYFEGKMISEKFTDERFTNYQDRPSAPQAKVELTDSVQEAWVRHYGSGLLPGEDIATATAVDTSGNVYVTGYSKTPSFGTDYFTVKYDASGKQVWAVRYDGSGEDVASAIAVDGAGNVYVTGKSEGSGTWYDYATIKYNPSGVEQWIARYNGPGNSSNGATAIALDGAGNVYVTGSSSGTGRSIYTTIKYTQGLTSVEEGETLPSRYELAQNYPNPFNPTTTISFSLPTKSYVSLKVYDMLGREVATLVEEYRESGRYKVEWNGSNLSSGVYVYKIKAGSFVSSKKMVFLK